MSNQLNILSIGAGAIGSYIGGAFHFAGHSVTFLEKPEIAEQLHQKGITIHHKNFTRKIEKPQVISNLTDIFSSAYFDVALFALKSFDTAGFLDSIRPFAGQFPPLLCLQNGVENEDLLRATLGAERVISATVTSAIGKLSLNEILIEKNRGVGIADEHPISSLLVNSLRQGGINARLYRNARSMKWSKLLTNLLANTSSAILDLTPLQIFSHPASYQIEVLQMKEALHLMRRLNIPVSNLPSTPVRPLVTIMERFPPRISQPLLIQFVGKGRGNKMPSFHIDLTAGRKESEVEVINGVVARLSQKIGIQAPVNQFLTQTLLSILDGNIPRDTYLHNPGKLLQDIQKTL